MGKRGERGRIQGERMALPAGHPFVSVRPSFLPPWLGWRWRWVVIKTKEGELRNSDANARNVIDVPRAACPSVGPSVPPSVRRVRPPIRLFTVVRPIDRGRKERASERDCGSGLRGISSEVSPPLPPQRRPWKAELLFRGAGCRRTDRSTDGQTDRGRRDGWTD